MWTLSRRVRSSWCAASAHARRLPLHTCAHHTLSCHWRAAAFAPASSPTPVPLPVQRLLEAEQIPHKVKPVSDYRNLGDIYVEQIASSTEVRQATSPPPPRARFEGG